MAHSFGKVLLSTQLACGFATAVDGRVDKIIDNLAVVRPTFMGAAPRIFEKAHGRIVTMQAAEGGVKEKLFNQAFKVGLEVDRLQARGQAGAVPAGRAARAVRQAGVHQDPRRASAAGCASSSPAPPRSTSEIAEWFHAAGILILEGYGMTESSAGSVVNHPDDYRFGSVGLVFPGTEIDDRRGRRDPDQGPGRHGGLPQPARADRRGADRGRLAAHRRHRRGRRAGLPADHRPQEGPVQDLRRQVHRPLGDRVAVQGDLPLRQPVPRARRRAELRGRADHPRPRRDRGLGRRERHGRQGRTPRSSRSPAGQGHGGGVRRRRSTPG